MSTYGSTDPRAALTGGDRSAPSAVAAAPAEYVRFHEVEPSQVDSHGRTWYVRGQNFVLAYSEVEPGWQAVRQGQPDEYVLLLPEPSAEASVEVEREAAKLQGASLVVMPPGDSSLQVENRGQVVRIFSIRARDLAVAAVNSASYREPHLAVAPFAAWPPSPKGEALRVYSLHVARTEGRFGRIFRCSTVMVNYLEPTIGPRDTTKMSPHTHDDFEQCSLALTGDYMHHLRWPWTIDMADWRPDEHVHCPAPSVVIIPPPTIHTSQAIGQGVNQLVDIFCPPRLDFSMQPGWVLNADDYPLLPTSES